MLAGLRKRWNLFWWRRKPYHERLAIVDEQDRLANTPENRAKAWDIFLDAHDHSPDSSDRRPIPHWFAVDRIGGLRPGEIPAHVQWQREQGWEVEE